MVRASDIARFLGRELVGNDLLVEQARAASNPRPHSVLFLKRYDPELVRLIVAASDVVVLASPEYEGQLTVPHIITRNPRLDFAKVVQRFFTPPGRSGLAATAFVAPTAQLGKGVAVGHYSVIGDGVHVGDGTEIRDHVVVAERCIIGRRCLIKSNTVIGEEGFGFDFEEDGTPVRLPHLGRVVIEDEVEIGALNTVARAVLNDTRLSSHVKTDDHVHIAHNVFVGRNTIITASAEISGSVRIGENVWIGPQAAIMNGIEIGDGAMIGLGAVVGKGVEPNMVVLGNPARVVRRRHPA